MGEEKGNMERQDSWKRTEEIEIDLLELIRQVCRHWKQALVCAVISALLLGGYSYLRNGVNTGETVLDEETDIIELTEEEQQGVDAALQLEKEVRGLETYMEGSILMRMDPYHKSKAVMLYGVDHSEGRDVQTIIECYLNFLSNGGAADKLEKGYKGGKGIRKGCLSELLTAYQRADGVRYPSAADDGAEDGSPGIVFYDNRPVGAVFYVETIGEDLEMAQDLAADLQAVLEEYHAEVAEMAGDHQLSLLSSEKCVVADDELQKIKQERKDLLSSKSSSLKGMIENFSAGQMAIYEQTADLDEDGKGTGIPDEPAIAEGPTVSKKFLLIGFMGGAFLYCCVYVCWYLFRDTVKGTGELRALYTFPYYGSIPLKKGAVGHGKGSAGEAQGTGAQERAQTLERIRLACRKQGIDRLCLAAGYSFDGQEKGYLEAAAQQLKEHGIDTVLTENVSEETAMWDTLTEVGNVLMVCRIGTTTHRMIDEEMEFYLENGIAMIGTVAFTVPGHY